MTQPLSSAPAQASPCQTTRHRGHPAMPQRLRPWLNPLCCPPQDFWSRAHSARAEPCLASFPATQGPRGTQVSHQLPPHNTQGPCRCQPVPWPPPAPPRAASLLLPASLSVVMVTRDVVTDEDGASHPNRAVHPRTGSVSSTLWLPFSPGLGRRPSMKPLPQAACWGCPICSDTALASPGQQLCPRQLV